MYFVVSAGGTAGHVNPALAVADELRRAGHDILFVGTPEHIESKLAAEAGFEFVGLDVSGFDKAHPTTLFSALGKVLKATRQVKERFRRRRPDAALTFGAYVSIPVGRAAISLGVPLVIHEQNSVAGMANRYLARKADCTALTYAVSARGLKCRHEPVVTGNPVRASFESSSRERGRTSVGIPADATVLLVCGGSLGARHLNSAICAMKERLLDVEGLHVVHSTGTADHAGVLEQLDLDAEAAARWHVYEYIDSMGDMLAASDLVVSRAGASSLAEIATVGVPAVLVPYPFARGDHQTLNAAACVEAGAAVLVPDAEVETCAFSDLVMELLADGQKRATMQDAAKGLSGADARVRLAALALDFAKGT